MCTDKTTKHLQDKQGANVALHATTGTTQDTWSTVQQRLEDMTETLKKLLTRVPEMYVEEHSRLQAGDFQDQTLGASAGSLGKSPQTTNETTTATNTVAGLPVNLMGNDSAAAPVNTEAKAALLVSETMSNEAKETADAEQTMRSRIAATPPFGGGLKHGAT